MKRWIHDAVNYQVNLRALAAREPRNAFEAVEERPSSSSKLTYVTDHLPHLKELGITIVHLMPPFPIGFRNRKGIGSPYAIRDYLNVDPEYGSKDELATLIRTAHELGLKVILGMVPNHTSCDNVWLDHHPEYYVRDAQGRIRHDLDWTDTAKLDYRNPDLRRTMLDVFDYWLSFPGEGPDGRTNGVDGFRIDMAHFINDLSFWDEALAELKSRHASRELLFMAECYGMENNLDLFRRGMNAAYDDDFYKLMVYFYGLDENGNSVILPDRKARRNDHFRDTYEAYRKGGLAGAAEQTLMNYERRLPLSDEAPRLARYTDNHDEGRGTFRYGDGAVRAMNRLIFFSGHALPFLLTGQEFGATNRPSIHERIQPCDKGSRTRQGRKVIAREGVEFEGNLFARGYDQRREWYAFYKELIALRRTTPELTRGAFALLDVGEDCAPSRRTVVAFSRTLDGRTLHGAVNLGPEARPLRKSAALLGESLYGGLDGGTLPPFEAVLTRAR